MRNNAVQNEILVTNDGFLQNKSGEIFVVDDIDLGNGISINLGTLPMETQRELLQGVADYFAFSGVSLEGTEKATGYQDHIDVEKATGETEVVTTTSAENFVEGLRERMAPIREQGSSTHQIERIRDIYDRHRSALEALEARSTIAVDESADASEPAKPPPSAAAPVTGKPTAEDGPPTSSATPLGSATVSVEESEDTSYHTATPPSDSEDGEVWLDAPLPPDDRIPPPPEMPLDDGESGVSKTPSPPPPLDLEPPPKPDPILTIAKQGAERAEGAKPTSQPDIAALTEAALMSVQRARSTDELFDGLEDELTDLWQKGHNLPLSSEWFLDETKLNELFELLNTLEALEPKQRPGRLEILMRQPSTSTSESPGRTVTRLLQSGAAPSHLLQKMAEAIAEQDHLITGRVAALKLPELESFSNYLSGKERDDWTLIEQKLSTYISEPPQYPKAAEVAIETAGATEKVDPAMRQLEVMRELIRAKPEEQGKLAMEFAGLVYANDPRLLGDLPQYSAVGEFMQIKKGGDFGDPDFERIAEVFIPFWTLLLDYEPKLSEDKLEAVISGLGSSKLNDLIIACQRKGVNNEIIESLFTYGQPAMQERYRKDLEAEIKRRKLEEIEAFQAVVEERQKSDAPTFLLQVATTYAPLLGIDSSGPTFEKDLRTQTKWLSKSRNLGNFLQNPDYWDINGANGEEAKMRILAFVVLSQMRQKDRTMLRLVQDSHNNAFVGLLHRELGKLNQGERLNLAARLDGLDPNWQLAARDLGDPYLPQRVPGATPLEGIKRLHHYLLGNESEKERVQRQLIELYGLARSVAKASGDDLLYKFRYSDELGFYVVPRKGGSDSRAGKNEEGQRAADEFITLLEDAKRLGIDQIEVELRSSTELKSEAHSFQLASLVEVMKNSRPSWWNNVINRDPNRRIRYQRLWIESSHGHHIRQGAGMSRLVEQLRPKIQAARNDLNPSNDSSLRGALRTFDVNADTLTKCATWIERLERGDDPEEITEQTLQFTGADADTRKAKAKAELTTLDGHFGQYLRSATYLSEAGSDQVKEVVVAYLKLALADKPELLAPIKTALKRASDAIEWDKVIRLVTAALATLETDRTE